MSRSVMPYTMIGTAENTTLKSIWAYRSYMGCMVHAHITLNQNCVQA